MNYLKSTLKIIDSSTSKITQKRSAISELMETISNRSIIEELNNNHLKKTSINWDNVLRISQRYIIGEADRCIDTERLGKSQTQTSDRIIGNCRILAIRVIEHSSSSEFLYLTRGSTLECIFEVLDNPRYHKYYLQTYLHILTNILLRVQHFVYFLNDSEWKEIIRILKGICLREDHDNITRHEIIKSLIHIFEHAPTYLLRSWCSFIVKQWEIAKECQQLKRSNDLLKMTQVYCEKVACDLRQSLCKLGEEILPQVLSCYEDRIEEYGGSKTTVFDFLLLQVTLHHPNGVTQYSDLAYAHDWTKWKSFLGQMYSKICQEADVYNRNLKNNKFIDLQKSDSLIWYNFRRLAVEVLIQREFNLLQRLNDDGGGEGSSVKRVRHTSAIETIFDEIKPGSSIPWLSILQLYIIRHSDKINLSNYTLILSRLLSFEFTIKMERHFQFQCYLALLEIENFIEHGVNKSELNNLWMKVWENTIRSFGHNENEDIWVTLTNKLLQSKTVDALSLLRVLNSKKLTIHHIQILNTIYYKYPLSIDKKDINYRYTLWETILSSFSDTNDMKSKQDVYQTDMTAQILIGLMLKQFPLIEIKNHQKENKNYLDNLENVYKKSIFLIDNKNTCNLSSENAKNISYRVDERSKNDLMEYLIRLHECFEEIRIKPMKLFEKIQITIDILIFSLNLLTASFEFNIINDTSTFPLIKTILTFLPILDENFTHGIENHSQIPLHEKIELIEHMIKLFDIKLHPKFFNEYSSLDVKLFSLLNKLYLLVEDGHGNLLKVQNDNMSTKNTSFLTKFSKSEKLLSHEERLVLRSFTALCNYIFKPNFTNTTPVQGKLLKILQDNFLTDLKYENVIDLKIGLVFCSAILNFKNSISNELLVNVFNILDSILKVNEHYFVVVLQIFEVFREILKHVAKSNNNELKNIAHKFLITLYSTEKHGPKIFTTILLTMKEIIVMNPQFNWTNGDGRFSNWDKLVSYTHCPYHNIRLLAIDIMYDIFNSNDFTIHLKKTFFSDIDRNIKKVLKVNDSETEEFSIVDEKNFRVCAVLYTYTLIACSDSRILPECLFSIICFAIKISAAKVQPSIKYILHKKQEKNSKNFFTSHLEYLVTKWCSGKHSFDKFPYQILGYNTDLDFYSENLSLIVPLFLMKNSIDVLKEICHKLNKNLEDLIEELFPELIVEILPLIACKTPLPDTDESIRTELRFLKTNLYAMVTEYNRAQLVQTKLQDILFNLIKKFDDIDYFYGEFNIVLPNNILQNSRVSFNYNTVKECIEFLENQADNKAAFTSFITMFAKISPNFFQKCLLKLSKPIHKSPYQHEQLLAFQQYILFCKWVEDYFQTQELKPVLEFILRDIVHNAINIITNSNQNDQLRMATCKYFIKFCATFIKTDKDIFKEHCHFIINSISPLTKNQTASYLHQSLFELLKILIVDNKETITESISELEPFPDEDDQFRMLNEIYDEVRYNTNNQQNLKSEIEIFLKIQNFENVSRLESLKRLHKLLEQQKDDLFRIYNQLKIQQGSFEMCRNSILHNLIISLIELSYSSDEEVKLMAAKCLGELGPSNLRSLILKVDFTQLVNSLDIDISLITAGVIIQLLSNYIVDKDWDIREMASEALYEVLSSPEGYCIIHNKPDNFDDIIGPINLHHIYPFITTDTKFEISEEFLFCVSNEFFNNLQDLDLWRPLYNTQDGHESWLKFLIYNILKSIERPRYIKIIIQLCEKKINFAEKLLPILIEMLLCKITNKNQIEIINNKISLFFHNIYNHYRVHHKSLKVMLDIVNLNKLRSHRDHTTDDKNFLNINYLHIAKAAYDCSSFFTAVFYAELWCRQKIQSLPQYRKDTRRLNIIEYICQKYPNEGEIMQKILRQSYTNIDDPDAVHGCGMSHLYNMEDRVEHYSKMGRWDQSVLYNDFMLTTTCISNSVLENAYRLSLKHAGLYNTANIYTKTIDYECLWRMQNWTLNKVIKDDDNETFEKYHYLALKNVYDQEPNYDHLKITRKLIVKSLQYNLETTKNLYGGLSRLQLLQEIEDFSKDYSFNNFNEIIFKWKKQSQMESKDFHYLEPIYNQRITLLEIAFNKTKEANIQNHLINFQINLAETARKQKWFQVARMALLKLKQVSNIENVQMCKLQLEEAQLEWDLNLDRNIGRSLLQNLLSSDFGGDKLLRSKAYRLYGTWMMETQSENPNIYFEEALHTLDRFNLHGDEENENRYSSYAALAKFTDNEHQEVKKYLNSQAFEIKQSCILKAKEICANFEAKCKKDQKEASADERKMYITNKKNYELDEADLENYRQMLKNNLLMAAKYYLLCLIKCENYNLSIFRLISLWLENRNHDELNDLIEEKLESIPTYKFLQVLPQIAPHITNSPADRFAEAVNNIIEKCTIDHPHHVLPIVFALANASKDNEFLNDNKKSKSSNSTSTSSHARVLQAQNIIKKLSKNVKIKKIVISMDAVSDALIKLAYYEEDEKHNIAPNTKQKIPSNHPILKLQNLDHIHFHTLDLPVKPSKNYDEIIGIYKWQNVWSTPGGINKPKKIICIGSDGIARNQMVKGKDDLRQDAVMQQVFNILNTLLISSDLRHLTIRTYKVVPLSRKSGILQWCDNTLPLSNYLLGSQGAHARYHPEDYTYLECVKRQKAAASKDNERKLHDFNDICAHYQPALHYFFFEKFGSTAAFWWEKRRAYTLSVAATSMIGYILGLGDRHLSNILIDTSTAEVIHIDFGIAFDQGKVLPTPETVPFRLSRDIEDGMGISGVEGVFRRSCEKTMSVLRRNSEIIKTILEVLLYDPLYMWNISVSTAMKIQARGGRQNFNATTQVVEETEVNKMAERALLRLTQKLQGIENGRIMSVEGQVEQLIQEARNSANLCRIYVGWSPFA